MAEPVDLWPHGVASKSDMKKFTVMMCGQGSEVIDYSSRLPFPSADSFFFFVPGGCAEWHSWEMYNKETGQWAGDLQCSTESS